MPAAATTSVNPAEAFTAGHRVVHRRSLNLGTVEGDTSGAWNAVFVRWDNGDAGMVRPYDLRLADGYVASVYAPTPAMVPQVCQQQQAKAGQINHPKPRQTVRGGFVVHRRGESTHRLLTHYRHPYEHPTLEAALAEARRLADEHNREFAVFGEISAVLPSVAQPGEAA